MNTSKLLMQGIMLGFVCYIFLLFCNTLYNMGYFAACLENNGHLYAVKKRTLKEGNILKYPFDDKRGEETKTSSCDSILESRITETEKTKE